MENTKQGQKRPHTAKKTKKETVKQVLASPFTLYWPLITNEECKTLEEAFNKCLPIREEKKIEKPHWKVLKEMTKEERKKFKQSNSATKKDYAFGVNEITKSLEKSTVQAVLIASDVSPRLLVKHVVDMCIIKTVPVLVVSDLRQSLQQRFGVSAVVFGVKSNDFLVQVMKKVHVNYPVPEDHIHYLRMLENNAEKHSENVVAQEVQMKESDEDDECEEKDEKEEDVKDLYLYRTSKRERVFKPEKSEGKVVKATVSLKADVGFLSLDDAVEKTERKSNYKALVVKRLKGNKDREKRKRELMVQKKKKGK